MIELEETPVHFCLSGSISQAGFFLFQALGTSHKRAGLVALWHVGLSQIRDQTRVSGISRWILYH